MPSIVFIDQTITSTKEKELERAKALSHAARVSHKAKHRREVTLRRNDSASSNSFSPPNKVALQFSDAFRAAGLEPTRRTRALIHTLTTAWAPSKEDAPIPDIFIRYISDPCRDDSSTAEAMLPLLAVTQRGVNSHFLATEILKYKNRIVRKLQSSITRGEEPFDSMIALFTAATLAGAQTEIQMHTEALRSLVMHKTNNEDVLELDSWIFRCEEKSLLNTAITSKPPRATKPSGQPKSPWYDFLSPVYKTFAKAMDPEIEGVLREICLDRLANAYLWYRICSSVRTMDGFPMALYVMGAMNSVAVRVLDYAADLEDRLGDEDLGPATCAYLHTQSAAAYTYLASSAYLSKSTRTVEFLAKARQHLEGVIAADTKLLSNRLIFFMYWMGACWEHGERSSVDGKEMWFTKGFITVASKLRVGDSEQVKRIIDAFCPPVLQSPDAFAWVDQVLLDK